MTALAAMIRWTAASALATATVLRAGSAAPEQGALHIEPRAPQEQRGIEQPASTGPSVAWAAALWPIEIENANSGAHASVRLYAADGSIDPFAFEAFAKVIGDSEDTVPIHPRVVQLALKAAYALKAHTLVVISAYRPGKPGRGGPHAAGVALDFKLTGTDSRKLAAHLRGYPRAGVGIYTHPRTQYVHLDVRDVSFHWLDGSPPGRTWREAPLPDKKRAERDAAYTPESDLPPAR